MPSEEPTTAFDETVSVAADESFGLDDGPSTDANEVVILSNKNQTNSL